MKKIIISVGIKLAVIAALITWAVVAGMPEPRQLPIQNTNTQVKKEELYIDLTTPERRKHILYGDKTGGGHKYGTGKAGKSEFPKSWSDDKIIHVISITARDKASQCKTQRNGYCKIDERIENIDLRVILGRDKKFIITGYPTNTRRNPI